MAFIDQVQDLTSLTVSDNDELSQFLKDGVIDVTSRWLLVKPQDIEDFVRGSSTQSSNGFDTSGDLDTFAISIAVIGFYECFYEFSIFCPRTQPQN